MINEYGSAFQRVKCPAYFLLQEVILHRYFTFALKFISLSKNKIANYIKNYFMHVVTQKNPVYNTFS